MQSKNPLVARIRTLATKPLSLVAAILIALTAVVVPLSLKPDAAVAAAGAAQAYSVKSTVTPSTLPVGGGMAKLTYTVTNNSQQGDKQLYFNSSSNSVCSLNSTGMTTTELGDYLAPGATAVFSCDVYIGQTTDVTQTFVFESADAFEATGNPAEKVTVTDRVEVAAAATGLPTCNTLWWASFGTSNTATVGSIGTFDPDTKAISRKFQVSYFVTRPATLYEGQRVIDGSAGFAIDPTNPRYGYFTGRYYGNIDTELYRIDLVTGGIVSLGESPAFQSVRMAIDKNGTLWSFNINGQLFEVPNVSSLTPRVSVASMPNTLTSPQVISHGTISWRTSTGAIASVANLQSGDLAVNGAGTLFILASNAADYSTQFLSIAAEDLKKSSGIVANYISTMYGSAGQTYNGLAFDMNGKLWASSSDDYGNSAIYTINQSTGGVTRVTTSAYTQTGAIGDMASCAMPSPRLVATKTATPNPIQAGGEITYSIEVENIGEISASGVKFTDPLPTGTTYVAGSTKLNGVTVADVNGQPFYSTAQEIHGSTTQFKGVIPEGDKATITFKVKVNAGQTKVCNQASTTFTSQTTPILTDDPALAGPTDPTCVPISKPGVEITKLINGNDANTSPGVPVPDGSDMEFTFKVTNTGNAALSNLTVTDSVIPASAITCPGTNNDTISTIFPGRSVFCKATLPAPEYGQQHANTATVKAIPPKNQDGSTPPALTDTDPAYAYTAASAAITVNKLINEQPVPVAPGIAVAEGSTMKMTFNVTNVGNARLTDVRVVDNVIKDISCPTTVLDKGQSMTCYGTAPAPAPGKQHVNNVTASGQPAPAPDGSIPARVSATDLAYAYVQPVSSVDLTKYINGEDSNLAPGAIVEPGSTMNVTFKVVNTGNVALSNVKVTDDTLTGISCPATTLAPGTAMTCTATAPAPKPGIQHRNNATVTASAPEGLINLPDTSVTDVDPAHAWVNPRAELKIDKKINGADAATAPGITVPEGTPMKVTYLVTNSGIVDMTGIKVTDMIDGVTDPVTATCPATTLAPGKPMTCTATIPAPAANVQHHNTATGVGTPALSDGTKLGEVIVTDEAFANVKPAPAITIDKRINGDAASAKPGVAVNEGSTLNYTFEVKNTGNTVLNDVTVQDPQLPVLSCPLTTLNPDQAMTCSASGPAPKPGVQHSNTATAKGTAPANVDGTPGATVDAADTAYAYVKSAPALKVTKLINERETPTQDNRVRVGEGSTMALSFEITNTGNVTISDIKVTDSVAGSYPDDISCPFNELEPGRTMVCTGSAPAPKAVANDADRTQDHHNTVTVTGTPPANLDGSPVVPVTATDEAWAYALPTPVPSMVLRKRINGANADVAPGVPVADGEPMNYEFEVINTGNTKLSLLSVTDSVIPASAITCPVKELPVGGSTLCTATGPAPAPGEQHHNVGTATATPIAADGTKLPPITNDDPAFAFVPYTPAMSIEKRINGKLADATPGVEVPEGSDMSVTVRVTNTGNAVLNNIKAFDDTAKDVVCEANSLNPSDSTVCTATVKAPAPGTVHHNTATVTADVPNNLDGTSNPPLLETAEAYAHVVAKPGIKVVKKLNGDDANAAPGAILPDGAPMSFEFIVTNTGNVPLTDIAVTDDAVRSIVCPATTLAGGESMTCTAFADAPAPGEQHHNTATVTGTPPAGLDGVPTEPIKDTDEAYGIVKPEPSMTVTKLLNGAEYDAAPGLTVVEGSEIHVDVKVTNTGNLPLKNVAVADDTVKNLTCPVTDVPVGETITCHGTVQAPALGTQHHNTATVTADSVLPDGTNGTPLTGSDVGYAVSTIDPTPAVSIKKTLNGDDAHSAPGVEVGENTVMDARFEVTNTGNVPLMDVVVTDDTTSAVTCPATTLDVGATMTCFTSIGAPAPGTQHHNVATVNAAAQREDGTAGQTVTSSDEAYAYSVEGPRPALSLVKLVNGQETLVEPGLPVAPNEPILLRFQVTNTGNTVVNDVSVKDQVDGVLDPTTVTPLSWKLTAEGYRADFNGTLQPGEIAFFDAVSIAPGHGDIHHDVATPTGTVPPQPGKDVPPLTTIPDEGFAHSSGNAELIVEKFINGDHAEVVPGVAVAAGSQMDVSYLIKNTGQVTINDIAIADDKIAADAISCLRVLDDGTERPVDNGNVTLNAGEEITCRATLAAPDVNVQHTNVAVVTGAPTANIDGTVPPLTPARDIAHAYVPGTPGVAIVKTINNDPASMDSPGTRTANGDTMDIQFKVTNTGDVELRDIAVTDNVLSEVSCPASVLPAGETMTCTGSAPAPGFGQSHANTATVVAVPAPGLDGTTPAPLTATDDAFAYTPAAPGQPALAVEKLLADDAADTAPGVRLGEGVDAPIRIIVTNTGDVELKDVKVTDSDAAVKDLTCPATTLAPGEVMTCTATLPGLPAGAEHSNTVTVTGVPPVNADGSTPPTPTATDAAHGFVPQKSSVSVVKKINGSASSESAPGVRVEAGSTMDVTFEVTNTGDAVLDTISVKDSTLPADAINCPAGPLAPGAKVTCTASLPAPLEGDSHVNTATVTGQPAPNPDGSVPPAVTDTDTAYAFTPPPAGTPSVTLVKKINGDDANVRPGIAVNAGDPLKVTFDVFNTGTVDLSDVKVTDDVITDITCPATSLAAGKSMTCTATVPALKAGEVHSNVGTVSANPPADADGNPSTPVTGIDTAHAHVVAAPSIAVDKVINDSAASDVAPGVEVAADEAMNVKFLVRNTGDVELTGISVNDSVIPADRISCPTTTLAAGAEMTCSATLDGIDAGVNHVNVVTVRGIPPLKPDGTAAAPVTAIDSAYAFAPAPVPTETPSTEATPTPSATSTPTPTPSETSTPSPTSTPVVPTEPTIVPVEEKPSVAIVKTINGDDANQAPGVIVDDQPLAVQIEVANTGNTTLKDIKVTDDPHGTVDCPQTELLAGERMVCTFELPPLADGASHKDEATVTATVVHLDGSTGGTGGTDTVTATDPAFAHNPDNPAAPGVKVVKTINNVDANLEPGVAIDAGDKMDVEFTVTNTGGTELTDITVTDSVVDQAAITCPATNLAAGDEMVCTATIDAPKPGETHSNTATVKATPVTPDGPTGTPVTDDDKAYAYAPKLDIEKVINGDTASNTAPGASLDAGVDYPVEFRVTNSSPVALTGVKVTDDKIADVSCPADILAPGQTMVCTATGAALQASDSHENTATVTGQPPARVDGTQPNPVTATDKAYAHAPEATPTPTPTSTVSPTPSQTESASPTPSSSVSPTPKPTSSGVVTGVPNTSTSQPLTEPSTTPVIPTEPTVVPIEEKPGVAIVKAINGDDANDSPGVIVADGAPLKVTVEVSNNGNTTLKDIKVTDDPYGAVTCPQTELLAGERMVCTFELPALKPGTKHRDEATVTATVIHLDGAEGGTGSTNTVTAKDPAYAHNPADPSAPGVVILKQVNGLAADLAPGAAIDAGDDMKFTFTVINTGGVDLVDVQVSDDTIAAKDISCPATTIPVGGRMECTATIPAPQPGESHSNIATVTAAPKKSDGTVGTPITDEDSAHAYAPGIKVTKLINGSLDSDKSPGVQAKAGDPLRVTVEVSNPNPVALTDIKVTDDKVKDVSCPADTLAPGQTMVCTATATALQAGEQHTNTVKVTGKPPARVDGTQPTSVSAEDTAYAYAGTEPATTPTPGGSSPGWLIPLIPLPFIIPGLLNTATPVVPAPTAPLTPAPSMTNAQPSDPAQPSLTPEENAPQQSPSTPTSAPTGQGSLAKTGVSNLGWVLGFALALLLAGSILARRRES